MRERENVRRDGNEGRGKGVKGKIEEMGVKKEKERRREGEKDGKK